MDSVSHVLDDDANTLSKMQYQPYGETFVHKGDTDFAPKYNSQELDRESGFYFYNARYYDPGIARFTSADTVIDGEWDTQGWNRFSYVKGNPIGAKDPTGHLTLILPGTRASAATWSENGGHEEFRQEVSKTFNDKNTEIVSKNDGTKLENNHADRTTFAKEIIDKINNHKFKDGEKLNIIAHSHAGNTVKHITTLIENGDSQLTGKSSKKTIQIDNIVNLGTPQRNDYKFGSKDKSGNKITGKIYNVSSKYDEIQVKGGCDSYLPWCSSGRHDSKSTKEIDASIVMRKEKMLNNKPVKPEIYNGHGDLHKTETWKQKIAPEIR